LEDIPAQPCRWDRVHRFVRGSYNLFQAALWPGHSSSRPEAIGEHQRDEQSDRRVQDGDFLKPDAIAETYWHLAHQDPSAWTMELEVRPFKEKF
jgi:NADP-dependent 3-hydroxy acid dehydrogenase YdfG